MNKKKRRLTQGISWLMGGSTQRGNLTVGKKKGAREERGKKKVYRMFTTTLRLSQTEAVHKQKWLSEKK